MYVNVDRKLVYLAHPKTASQSTAAALADKGFVRSIYVPGSLPHRLGTERGPEHHKGLIRHPEGWTVFCVVRNHFDALTSWWAFQARKPVLKGKPLTPEYLENLMGAFPKYFVHPNRMWDMHARVSDRTLRYESLEEDLGDVLGEPVCLPMKNVSPEREGRHYRELINPEVREYIEDRFGDEMAHYGYCW